ncbi:hypothetical protein [Actinomadura decatromicini]|uniref:Uncharacterized protein n=1 Tax=Actinomadura decatromicini TaxID=2604572 RepID=A0A5D3FA64_9ACTN|nr:hypothetical protein [Actinomadura decatromicini]TYK45093.1 hypothetical protein FXF68_30900 [Actinomadura decatromicini]
MSMPVVSVLAAPSGVELPGVPFGDLGSFSQWLDTVLPVSRWVAGVQGAGITVHVCGQDTRIPEGCRHLDVPLTDSEYARFEQAFVDAIDRSSHGQA